jgi:hypothetical protein
MLLWDLDFGLGTTSSHPEDTSLFHEIVDPVISNLFLGTPTYLRGYLQSVKEIVNGPMLFANVDPVVDNLYEGLVLNDIEAFPPDDMKTWIGLRRNHVQTQLLAWEAPFAITSNGGNPFSTNLNYITLSGTAPLDVRTLRVNGVTYEPQWTSASNWAVTVVLTPGLNSLAVEGVDEDGNTVGGATDSIDITYTGGSASPAGSLVINEVMYNPAVASAEFLEIHNRSSTHAFDLYDFKVDGIDLTFTASAVVAPGGFVVLAEDPLVFATIHGGVAVAGDYAGSLDNNGERLQLIQLNGTNTDVLVDDFLYDDEAPWPVSADGAGPSLQLVDGGEDNNRIGNWSTDGSILYTPGATNSVVQDLPSFPLIWLNELLATNTAGIFDNATNRDPWVELFSQHGTDATLTNFYLTDTYTNLAKWAFPGAAFVPSNGFRLVWLDNQTNQNAGTNIHAALRPATTNGSIALVLSNGTNLIIVDYMNHPAIATNLSYGDYPDGAWTNRAIFQVATPGTTNSVSSVAPVAVKVNEFAAQNASIADPYGEFNDWIEVYNTGTNNVDLGGFGLTDNLSQPFKWRFPSNTIIGPHAFLVVWADNDQFPVGRTNGVFATNFALSAGGEAIGLYKPDGSALDAFTFGPQTTDVTRGRWPDGVDPMNWLGYPTPGSANVSRSNNVPVLTAIGNKNVDEQSPLSFAVSASDTDTPPQTLTFTLDPGAPTNAAIGALSGLFTWTPGEGQGPATNTFAIRATDNGYLNRTVAETITVTVAEVNQSPVLQAVGPFNVNPRSQLSYHMVAQDADVPANSMTFSSFPDPAAISTGGVFSWTPSDGDALTTNGFVITVIDNGTPPLSATSQVVVVVSGADQYFDASAFPDPNGTGMVVRWSAETGETYRVFYADDMTGPVWTELAGDITATDTVAEKNDTTTNALAQRFYKIIRLLP